MERSDTNNSWFQRRCWVSRSAQPNIWTCNLKSRGWLLSYSLLHLPALAPGPIVHVPEIDFVALRRAAQEDTSAIYPAYDLDVRIVADAGSRHSNEPPSLSPAPVVVVVQVDRRSVARAAQKLFAWIRSARQRDVEYAGEVVDRRNVPDLAAAAVVDLPQIDLAVRRAAEQRTRRDKTPKDLEIVRALRIYKVLPGLLDDDSRWMATVDGAMV